MNTHAFSSANPTADQETIPGSGSTAIENDRSFFLRGTSNRTKYKYDAAGNRTRESSDCWCFDYSYHPSTSQLKEKRRVTSTDVSNTCSCNGMGVVNSGASDPYLMSYEYVPGGRTSAKKWGPSGSNYQIHFNGSVDGLHAATGSVFRDVTVAGQGYQYFYDAYGRRRLKREPFGEEQEFFFDGTTLLADWGYPVRDEISYAPLDEYVWLAGRPVAVIKSSWFNAGDGQWHRDADFAGSCGRERAAACGVYYPITDYIGKPVALLDARLKVVGAYDYDPFGHVNRVTAMGDTRHPYGINENQLLVNFKQPPSFVNGVQKTAVQLRPIFALMDINTSGTDEVFLTTLQGEPKGPGYRGGAGTPRRLPEWVGVPADGVLQVRFKSDGESETLRLGAVVEGYEYARYEYQSDGSVQSVEFPLRFPGQYYDTETDLAENWNRFFDPSVGRYLASEQMLTMPSHVRTEAASGRNVEVYAYAANNPMWGTDPTGLVLEYNKEPGRLSARTIRAWTRMCRGGGQSMCNAMHRSKVKYMVGDKDLNGPVLVGKIEGARTDASRVRSEGVAEVNFDWRAMPAVNEQRKAEGKREHTDVSAAGHEAVHGVRLVDGIDNAVQPNPGETGTPEERLQQEEAHADDVGFAIEDGQECSTTGDRVVCSGATVSEDPQGAEPHRK